VPGAVEDDGMEVRGQPQIGQRPLHDGDGAGLRPAGKFPPEGPIYTPTIYKLKPSIPYEKRHPEDPNCWRRCGACGHPCSSHYLDHCNAATSSNELCACPGWWKGNADLRKKNARASS
jgi:hypothetical protein